MIQTKDSVRFSILRHEMYSTWETVERIFLSHKIKPVITCGTEAHGPDDPHTHGFAEDWRSKHIPTSEMKHEILEELRRELGSLYTVLLENENTENEHFHRQIKKGIWQTLI